MKEETKKKVLLITICVVTLAVLFVAIRLNEKRLNESLSTSKIDAYLSEIKYEELPNHLVEKPDAIVYVSNSSEQESIKFEGKFQNVIKKHNLENDIVYVNLNNLNIADVNYTYAPELIFYKDGKVSDVINATNLKLERDIIKIFRDRNIILR
ncbi:MAG: DUF6568 family protein [Bacilli bacterium]